MFFLFFCFFVFLFFVCFFVFLFLIVLRQVGGIKEGLSIEKVQIVRKNSFLFLETFDEILEFLADQIHSEHPVLMFTASDFDCVVFAIMPDFFDVRTFCHRNEVISAMSDKFFYQLDIIWSIDDEFSQIKIRDNRLIICFVVVGECSRILEVRAFEKVFTINNKLIKIK